MFWINFLRYVLLCWSLGLLSYGSGEMTVMPDDPIWLIINTVLNLLITVISFRLFAKYVFKSKKITQIESKCFAGLCAIGVSLVYLLVSFSIMYFVL